MLIKRRINYEFTSCFKIIAFCSSLCLHCMAACNSACLLASSSKLWACPWQQIKSKTWLVWALLILTFRNHKIGTRNSTTVCDLLMKSASIHIQESFKVSNTSCKYENRKRKSPFLIWEMLENMVGVFFLQRFSNANGFERLIANKLLCITY